MEKMIDVAQLDAETASFLEGFSKLFASIAHLSIPEQRSTIRNLFCVPKEQLEPIGKFEEKVISGRHGPIPIRIYTPKNESHLPVLIYLHRGGFVYGSLDESESICRRFANQLGVVVASVEYRLAPEYKFPIPLEDCYDATKWIVQHADKAIICGESAGGNLAAAVALMAKDTREFKLAGQLLIYPILTTNLEKSHYEASPDKALLSYENMQFFLDAYLFPKDRGNPYAAPLKSHSFTGLPPCFIITAEHDALKTEGVRYGTALRRAHNEVHEKCYLNVIHGFLDLPIAQETKEQALKDIAAWMQTL